MQTPNPKAGKDTDEILLILKNEFDIDTSKHNRIWSKVFKIFEKEQDPQKHIGSMGNQTELQNLVHEFNGKQMKYKLPKGVYELSLRPYCGRLFIAETQIDYQEAYLEIYGDSTMVPTNNKGKFCVGNGMDGMGTYLIWATEIPIWAHELTHVILDLLPAMGFNLNDTACDEAACYLMQALLTDVIRIFYNQEISLA